jgi:hypothetical protein
MSLDFFVLFFFGCRLDLCWRADSRDARVEGSRTAKAGGGRRAFSRIERGEVYVRMSTLLKVAAALGVPLKELMP